MKKINIIFVLLCTILGMNMIIVKAENKVYSSTEIPNRFKPYSQIKFIDNSHYIETDEIYNTNDYKELENSESVNGNGTIIESYPNPVKGLYVYYGTNGILERIYHRREEKINTAYKVEIVPTQYNLTRGVDDPHYRTIASWGDRNYLYEGINNYGKYRIRGIGNATVYTDVYGQYDYKLHKGCVATKQQFDNMKFGGEVMVTLDTKAGGRKTVRMIKRDIGKMPNAIIDIWKTGVEYWGYKYSSDYRDDNATIEHN